METRGTAVGGRFGRTAGLRHWKVMSRLSSAWFSSRKRTQCSEHFLCFCRSTFARVFACRTPSSTRRRKAPGEGILYLLCAPCCTQHSACHMVGSTEYLLNKRNVLAKKVIQSHRNSSSDRKLLLSFGSTCCLWS